jgi:hypothetical protein
MLTEMFVEKLLTSLIGVGDGRAWKSVDESMSRTTRTPSALDLKLRCPKMIRLSGPRKPFF